MKFWVISLIYTIVITTVLAWVVYVRNSNRPPNRRFPIFAAALAIWSCVDILLMSVNQIVHQVVLLKIAGVLGALLPSAFVFFATGFDQRETKITKNIQLYSFLMGVLASLFTLHPSFIKKIIISESLQDRLPGPDVVYGWPFVVYSLIIMSLMFFGLRYLYRLMRSKTGIQRTEIQYIFLAIITGTFFAVATTLIAPMFGNTALCRFGSMSSIIMVSIIAYAIAKHKILNISIFAEKTFIYGCLVAGLMVIYLFLVWSLSHFIRAFNPHESLLPIIISSFIIAIAFSPMKEIIQNWAKRKIFKQKFDIEQTLAQIRFLIGRSLNFEEGFSALIEIISSEIRISQKPLLIISFEPAAKRIFLEMSVNSKYEIKFDEGSPILKMLKSEPFTHFKDELLRFSSRATIGCVISEMEKYNAEVAIPINFRNKVIGAILLGKKIDDISFSNVERRMLNALPLYLGIFIETMDLATTLRENRIYQQSLLENLPSGVIAVDREHNVIVFNQEAERIIGLRKENVLGRRFEEIIPYPLSELFHRLFNSKSEIRNCEVELNKNNNIVVPLIVNGSCFYSPSNALLGAQLIFSDISQLKMLQNQLDRNKRLASLGILAAGIAHEIRNPLVALKTFSQLLPEKFEDSEFRSNYAKVVIPEIERIDHLVEQLLIFAKPRPARMEKVDLISIIESTLLLLKVQSKFDRISFVKNYGVNSVEIIADPEKIKQAFWNIFLNSAEAFQGKSGLIKIYLNTSDDNVIVVVEDNGCGIPEENMGKIFEPLFTTKPEGTGLGLPIVNEIIAQHNGRIDIVSKEGVGTRVTVILPLNNKVQQ
ncbi:MAG: ATP-binding protein [Candidatus Omnitrophica bacterium]|nr:ATP-binding protein [Candidatus Omnitrophota bacterium]